MPNISMNLVTASRRPTIAGLALAVLVAACSGAPAGGTANSPANPTAAGSVPAPTSVGPGGGVPTEMCPLISGADVAMIVARDLAETRPEGNWCTWTFTERRTGAIAGIDGTVIVRYEGDTATLDSVKRAFPGGEDVSIAEGGYWSDDFSVLYVVKGGHVYAVQLILFDKAEPRKDMATRVAQLLLAKL